MVEMFFSLKFRSQLARTRPEVVTVIESGIINSVRLSGAVVRRENKAISAHFDEHKIGFWLDIMFVIETVRRLLEGNKRELYGHICVFAQTLDIDTAETLKKKLSRVDDPDAVWCAESITKEIKSFAEFKNREYRPALSFLTSETEHKPGAATQTAAVTDTQAAAAAVTDTQTAAVTETQAAAAAAAASSAFFDPLQDGAYYELDTLRDFSGVEQKFPLRKKIEKILLVDKYRGTVLLGPEFIGKADGLEWYCREENGFYKPLIIRFTRQSGISCFVDAYSGVYKTTAENESGGRRERLAALYAALFAERLRRELSAPVLKQAREYLTLLLDLYLEGARDTPLIPVVILENIEKAAPPAARLFLDVWSEAAKKRRVVALGSGSGGCAASFAASKEASPAASKEADTPLPPPSGGGNAGGIAAGVAAEWRQVFPGVINCTVEKPQFFDAGAYSVSLLEIAYTCFLLGKFFPAECFIELFEEEGKNAEVLRKSLEILASYGIIRGADDPVPARGALEERIEKALGERTAFIKSVVKNRLLDWVARGKLSPCFDLLQALRGLDASASCLLTLECIKSDITSGAFEAVEKALEDGSFTEITGAEYAPSLLYIYKTLKSLMYGSETEIIQTFKTGAPDKIPNTEYKARILSIQAIFRMGMNDTQPALDQIKESMILYQETRERAGISLVYRLFSLLNLSKHEINDAIDYLNYAVEYNKNSKDDNEKTLGYYYSSIVNFIFGNISKAQRIMNQALPQASLSGSAAWACKSEFMLARYHFETGEYAAARKLFESLLEKYEPAVAEGLIRKDWGKTVQAWIERTKLYLGCHTTLLKELSCEDALLFRLEETYLNEEYAQTVELADEILAQPVKNEFILLEQPCWTSGFSQCELIPFTKQHFWGRVAPVWRSLALSKLGGSEEAVRTMQKIMRDERLNETDPNMPFYFFANYRIIVEAELSEVDRNTAISMAFKRLQRRAGRIDDVKARQSYLSNQYWNNALFTTAKEYKLI